MKTIVAAVFLLAATGATPVFASGAIAIGQPANIAKNGVAAGMSGDFKTPKAAQQDAIKQCKAGTEAPASTRALCKVVQSYSNKCAAIAADPGANRPGFGWAIGAGSASASQVALNKCRATAGLFRGQACKVIAVSCDGSAK